ncbi:MAG: LysR family transcriptional regulator [Pseudomonadota bacterium]
MNWDNYRFLVALEVCGSFSAVARELKVSQPTVARRLNELEDDLGVTLFERLPDGVTMTAIGKRICQCAHLMNRQATQIQMEARDGDQATSARVRLAASEGIAFAFLTQLIARFCRDQPDIGVDLQISNRPADILNREADIAVRLGDPKDENLIGRRVAEVAFDIYGHDLYLADHGSPSQAEDFAAHKIIESTGEIANLPQAIWLRNLAAGAGVAYSANSLVNQVRALTQGLGLLALPCYLAVDLVGIRRVAINQPSPTADIWLLTERRIRDQPAVGALFAYLASEIPKMMDRLSP